MGNKLQMNACRECVDGVSDGGVIRVKGPNPGAAQVGRTHGRLAWGRGKGNLRLGPGERCLQERDHSTEAEAQRGASTEETRHFFLCVPASPAGPFRCLNSAEADVMPSGCRPHRADKCGTNASEEAKHPSRCSLRWFTPCSFLTPYPK